MPFKVGEQVIHPAFGLGRVVSRVTKPFGESAAQEYYEIAGPRSTIWVPVVQTAGPSLRRLTRKAELARYRGVLSGQPAVLNADCRLRLAKARSKAHRGTLRAVCEVVRDLSAHSGEKPLNECDASVLRRSRRALVEEWAAAAGVTLLAATEEVNALLGRGRQTHRS